MRIFHQSLNIVKIHRRVFVVMNMAFYGLFAASMIVTMFVPELHSFATRTFDLAKVDNGVIKALLAATRHHDFLTTTALIFSVNLAVTLLFTTAPSCLIPYLGILAVGQRAVTWGMQFAPIGVYRTMFVPHLPTLLMEGFAYVVAAFAAYLHADATLRPHRNGLASHLDGYKHGLAITLRLYLVVILVLLVAAAYEAMETIYLLRFFF